MTQFSVSLDKIAQQLKLEVVYTPKELKDIPIYTADVNRPGLLLTGYDEYFDPTRIQIYGNAEMGYLSTLPEAERRSRMHTLFATKPPALVVTRSLAVFSEIMEFASQYGVPVLRTAPGGSVVWVGGIRLDDRFKCTALSRVLIQLTIRPLDSAVVVRSVG